MYAAEVMMNIVQLRPSLTHAVGKGHYSAAQAKGKNSAFTYQALSQLLCTVVISMLIESIIY